MNTLSRNLPPPTQFCCRLTTAAFLFTATTTASCTGRQPRVEAAIISDSTSAKLQSDSVSNVVPVDINIYRPGVHHYDYRLNAIVQSTAGDSTPRVDSSETIAVLTTSFQMPVRGALEARIQVDSATTIIRAHVTTTYVSPSQSFVFKITPTTGQVLQESDLVRPDPSSCSERATESPFHGTELLPRIQPGVKAWTDSSGVRECRGSILLVFSRTMHYKLGEPSSTGQQLVRVTDALVTGSGAQWNQPVRVSGKGTSVDTFFISQSPPQLQRLSGTSLLEMAFQSQLRSQRFIQATMVSAMIRP